MITKEQLDLLFKVNPNAKIYRADNLLYIDTGAEKNIISLPANKIEKIIGKHVTQHTYSLDKATRDSLASYTLRGNIDISKIGRVVQPKEPAILNPKKVRRSSGERKERKTLKYPEVSKTRINTVVNDFFTAYYDPTHRINRMKLEDAFSVYSRSKMMPIEDPNIDPNKSIFNQVKKVALAIEKEPSVKKALKSGTRKVLSAPMKSLKRHGPQENIKILQEVIDTGSEYILFTNKQIPNTELQTEGAKIGTTIRRHFGDTKALKIVTPSGVVNILPRKDKVMVRGFEVPKTEIPKYDELEAFNKHGHTKAKVNVAASEAFYMKTQRRVETEALEKIMTIAKASVRQMDYEQADELFHNTTVKDVKNVASIMDQRSEYLETYTLKDDMPLSEALPAKHYQEILSGAKNKSHVRLEGSLKDKYNKVVSLGKKLGVSTEEIDTDLEKVFSKKDPEKSRIKTGQMLNSMDNTFTQSLITDPKASKNAQSIRNLPKVHFGPPKANYIVKALRNGSEGLDWLKSRHLLEATKANPLLNLEGNIQSKYAKDIMAAMFQDAKSNDVPYNAEAITKLGSLLSEKDMSKVQKRFEAKGKHFSFNEKRAFVNEMWYKKPKATTSKELTNYLDTKLLLTDVYHNLTTKFGGQDEIAIHKKNIASGTLEKDRVKTMEAIDWDSKGEGQKPIYDANDMEAIGNMLTEESILQGEYDKQEVRRKQQQEMINLDPAVKFADADLNAMSQKQRLNLATEDIANAGGKRVKVGQTDLLELKQKINKYSSAIEAGHLGLGDYQEMLNEAGTLGFSGLDKFKDKKGKFRKYGSSFEPKKVMSFLQEQYDMKFDQLYPGTRSEGGKVRVNLTKALYKDAVRQSPVSAKRVGLTDLNLAQFKKASALKFSEKPNKTKLSNQEKSTRALMIDMYGADWKAAVEAYHGKGIGNTQLIFGDRKTAKIKAEILNSISLAADVDRNKMFKLQEVFASNDIYTNREEVALKNLKEGLVVNPSTGKVALDPKLDVNFEMDRMLAPYNLPEFKAKPGELYVGKKRVNFPVLPFNSYFNPNEMKMVQDGSLTKLQRDQALTFLSETNTMKEFQAQGKYGAPNQMEMASKVNSVMNNGNQFIDRQVGLYLGISGKGTPNDKAIKTRDSVKAGVAAKIDQYTTLVFEASQKGDFQTARAYLDGLDSLNSTFKGGLNKTNFEFAERLIVDTNGAMNSKVVGKANSYLGEKALSSAIGFGAYITEGQEGIKEDAAARARIKAAKVRGDTLNYKALDHIPEGTTYQEFLDNHLLNRDPQDKAITLANEKIAKAAKLTTDRVSALYGRQAGKEKVMTKSLQLDANQEPFISHSLLEPLPGLTTADMSMAPNKSQFSGSHPYAPKSAGFALFQSSNLARDLDEVPKKTLAKIIAQKELLKGKTPVASKVDYSDRSLWKPPSQEEYIADQKRMEKIMLRRSIKNWSKNPKQKHNWLKPLHFSSGGKVPGKGTKDEVPSLLTKGETVLDVETSTKLGIHSQEDYDRFKVAVRNNKVKKFADGGGSWEIDTSIVGLAALEEANRLANKITLDLAKGAENLNVKYNDMQAIDALSAAKSNGVNKLDSLTFASAKRNLAEVSMTKALNLNTKELQLLNKTQGNIKDTTPLPEELVKKIVDMDIDTLKTSMEGLKEIPGLTKDFVTPIEKAIGQVKAKEAKAFNIKKVDNDKKTYGSKTFQHDLLALSHDSKILSEVYGISEEFFKSLPGKPKIDVIKAATKEFKGKNFDQIKHTTYNKSVPELVAEGEASDVLNRFMGDKDFKTDLRDERRGIQGTREQINRSKGLKTSAQSRVGEFSSLMLQNAAFGMSYAVLGGVQTGLATTIGFVANFSDSLKNLQAITGDTDEGLKVMSDSVKKVSTETKFSALEIAEAATILGQAGFSAIDISKSLGGVVELATATGSRLEDATQILTSTLTIWDKSLTESKKTSNEFTAAINESKLDIESLTGAIQYTGNIAAEAGISSTDVITMTSLLKDAGIKRASTLGTGQRLLFGDFAAPSKRFITSLKTVGIELETFTKAFNDEGLYGALKLMKDAGYGLAAASRGMEVREKAIYVAASNQLDKFKPFREDITGTNAAYIANRTQMEGVGNSFKNMLNSWQINLNNSFEDQTSMIVGAFKGLTITEDKKDPKKTLGVEGYSLKEKLTPKTESNGIVGGIALASLAGQLIGNNKEYLLERSASLEASRRGAIFSTAGRVAGSKLAPVTNTIPKGIVSTELTTLQKGVVGLTKATTLLTSSLFKTGLSLAGAGAVGYATAPEGSEVAGLTSGLVAMGAWEATSASMNRFAAARGKSAPGIASKIGVAGAIMLADQYVVGPSREKGEGGGVLGTAIEGAALAGAYAPGPWKIPAAAAGFLAGGALGKMSEKEAPEITYAMALGHVVNAAKAYTSEMEAMTKSVASLSDSSNFALRMSPAKTLSDNPEARKMQQDERQVEKIAKTRATVKEMQNFSEQIKLLETALNTDFRLGDAIANTPYKASEASIEQIERARLSGKPVASLEDNVYERREYSVEGKEVKSKIVAYQGLAPDAQAAELSSAVGAAFKAINAEGGVNDNLAKELVTKSNKNLIKEVQKAITKESAGSAEIYALFTKKVMQPTRDFIKRAPVMALKQLETLKQSSRLAFGDLKKEVYKNTGIGQTYSTKEAKKIVSEMTVKYDAGMANMDNLIKDIGARLTSKEAAIATARIHLDGLAKKQPGTNKQDILEQYMSSDRFKQVSNAYVNDSMIRDGIKPMRDTMLSGRNKLTDIDTVGVNLTRKLTGQVAKVLTTQIGKIGPTITLKAAEIGKALVKPMSAINSGLKESISAWGDLTNKNTELFLKENSDSSFTPKDFKDIVTGAPGARKIKDVSLDTEGIVDVSRLNTEAIKTNSKIILAKYKLAENEGAAIAKQVVGFNNLQEAYTSGDTFLVEAFKNLGVQLDKAGIASTRAFNVLTQVGTPSREKLKKVSVEGLLNYFTPRVKQKINDQKEVAVDNLKLKQIQAKELQVKNVEFQKEQLQKSSEDSKDKAARGYEFNKENLTINFTNQLNKIARQGAYAQQDAIRNFNKNLYLMNEQFKNSRAKAVRQKDYSLEDLETSRSRGQRDLLISETRGQRDLQLSNSRGTRDLDLSGARGMADIATSKARGFAKIDLGKARNIEDLNIRYARALEDQSPKKGQSTRDLELKRERNIEDAMRSFADNMAKILRNYQDNLAALERSRQDTMNAFTRSLEKPQVITLDPAALTVIADNIGSVSLALDAHKAALTANTTAVQQNNALQQTAEDVAKDAYKDAYKKVGGEVYKADGAINEDFTAAYDDYMAKNSEALIDAVLENALNAAYAGVGFDVSSALGSAEYLAGQVSAPTPGMTMPSAVAGSGLTVDELIAALYDVKADQVRVTTTAGVILEAQGGMEAAIFDLETAFINIDIKIREAGISFGISVREAKISLENSLRDIEIAYQRSLMDLNTAFERQTTDLALMLSRGMEDIALNTARNIEDLTTSIANATEDLALKLSRGAEDLKTKLADAGYDLSVKIGDAGEDLRRKLADATADIDTNFKRGITESAIAFREQLEIAGIQLSFQLQDIAINTRRSMDEAAIAFDQSLESLDRNYENQLLEIDEAIIGGLQKLSDGFKNSMDTLNLQYDQSMVQLKVQQEEAIIKMFQASATWSQRLLASLEQGFGTSVFNTSKLVANLQMQVNESFSKFTIESEVILQGVLSSFKAVLESPAFINLLSTYVGTGLGEAMTKGLTEVSTSALTVISEMNAALKKSFKLELAKPMEEVALNIKKNGEVIDSSLATVNIAVETTAVTLAETAIKINKAAPEEASKKMTLLTTSLVDMSTKLPGIATTLSTGLNGITKIADEAKLKTGTTKLVINAVSETLSRSIEGLGISLAMATNQALIAIAQAQRLALNTTPTVSPTPAPTSAPTKNSMGGLVLGGYGGGDIKPYMLEPGEFNLRKEVVRQIGVNKLEDINNGVGGALTVDSKAIGLPLSGGSAISVQMNVEAGSSLETLQDNMEMIADGVKKVFEEYS